MRWKCKESEGQGKDLKEDKHIQGKIALCCQEKCGLVIDTMDNLISWNG